MPFAIVRDDITRVKADAIVNAANEQLRMGGGVCGQIFRAAGARQLQQACDEIGHCPTGGAVATPGFGLPAKYVIHTPGPIWGGGSHGERELLASCYTSSLMLAEQLGCTSIAFPLISAGIYGYPHLEAIEVAQEAIRAFLADHEMQVTLVLYGIRAMELAGGMGLRIKSYIDDVYVGAHAAEQARLPWENRPHASVMVWPEEVEEAAAPSEAPTPTTLCPHCGHRIAADAHSCPRCGASLKDQAAAGDTGAFANAMPMASAATDMAKPAPRTSAATPKAGRRKVSLANPLRNLLRHMDASFSETLLTLIDERGLKDAQVYKKANISRQHFSKMRSNPQYKPTKTTVLALAVALELSLEETQMLLERAGFALSHADRRDIIVEFFIREGIYDIFQINDALFAFDQPLLG